MGSYVGNVNGTTIAAPYVPTGQVQPRQRHPVRATGDLKMPLSARCRQRRVHRLFPRHRQVPRNGNFTRHRAIRASLKISGASGAVPLRLRFGAGGYCRGQRVSGTHTLLVRSRIARNGAVVVAENALVSGGPGDAVPGEGTGSAGVGVAVSRAYKK